MWTQLAFVHVFFPPLGDKWVEGSRKGWRGIHERSERWPKEKAKWGSHGAGWASDWTGKALDGAGMASNKAGRAKLRQMPCIRSGCVFIDFAPKFKKDKLHWYSCHPVSFYSETHLTDVTRWIDSFLRWMYPLLMWRLMLLLQMMLLQMLLRLLLLSK